MTAENVQQQTVMTQQIQEAIGAARELSQETVKLAQNSAGRVEENLGVMEQMKRHRRSYGGLHIFGCLACVIPQFSNDPRNVLRGFSCLFGQLAERT